MKFQHNEQPQWAPFELHSFFEASVSNPVSNGIQMRAEIQESFMTTSVNGQFSLACQWSQTDAMMDLSNKP